MVNHRHHACDHGRVHGDGSWCQFLMLLQGDCHNLFTYQTTSHLGVWQ